MRRSSEIGDVSMVVKYPIFSGEFSKKEPNRTFYSDRLRQNYPEKFGMLSKKYFNEEVQHNSWLACFPKDIEKFL